MSAPINHNPLVYNYTPSKRSPFQGILKVGNKEYDVTIDVSMNPTADELDLSHVASGAFYLLKQQGLITDNFKEATITKEGIFDENSQKTDFDPKIKEFAEAFFDKIENKRKKSEFSEVMKDVSVLGLPKKLAKGTYNKAKTVIGVANSGLRTGRRFIDGVKKLGNRLENTRAKVTNSLMSWIAPNELFANERP